MNPLLICYSLHVIQMQKAVVSELKQKVTESHAGESNMRAQMEQSQQEVESVRNKYGGDVQALQQEVDTLTTDLKEMSAKAEAEARNAVSPLFQFVVCACV